MNDAQQHPDYQTPNPPSWTPASPIKRVWAWVGVVYVVLATLLVTWSLATASYLRGIGGIMVCPALVGLGISAVIRSRSETGRGWMGLGILIAAACAVLIVLGLLNGLPALLSQLGGSQR
ncbi:MAG: hypothetical protein LKK00_07385 [Intestinimonas sp.]|jgi:hypothetical protein|nr:hypothetical protein [Intestinimonas sp.]